MYIYIYMYNLGIVGWWGCRRIPGEKLLICETSEAPFWISPAFLTDATSPPHYDKPDRSWQLIQLIQSFKEHLFSEKKPQQSSILAVLCFLFGSVTKQDQLINHHSSPITHQFHVWETQVVLKPKASRPRRLVGLEGLERCRFWILLLVCLGLFLVSGGVCFFFDFKW